jgi:hypothetical protein
MDSDELPLGVPPRDPVDDLVLAALLQQSMFVVNGEEELAEIVSSQAHTDRIPISVPAQIGDTPGHFVVHVEPRILAADSQPVVPLSPSGIADDDGSRAVAAAPEPRTPQGNVSTVVLPLAPTPRWLRVDRGVDQRAPVAATTADASGIGSRNEQLPVPPVWRPRHARARRELFADDDEQQHPPSPPPTPPIDDAEPNGTGRRSPYALRRDPVRALSPQEMLEFIEGDEHLNRMRRLRTHKLNWANKQKRLHKHRQNVINWMLATHPELVTEYETSAMNVDGVRIKDLL